MLNFPDSPTVNQVFTSGGTSWTWDGTKWVANTATTGAITSITVGTGLTATPNPIVGSGSQSLTVPVTVANGGTGSSTAPTALTALGALPIAGGTVTGNLTVNGVLQAGPAATGDLGQITIVAPADTLNALVIARNGASPMELMFGVNQTSLYTEVQSLQYSVAFQKLIVNRRGGNVGVQTPSANPQAMLQVGESAGTARVYNSYTDASNSEWGYMGDWVKAASILTYGSDKNGTGNIRDVSFLRGGNENIRLMSTGVVTFTPLTNTYNGFSTRPGSAGIPTFMLANNYAGLIEVDFWNTNNSGTGFFFYQKTAAAAETLCGIIGLNGLSAPAGIVGKTDASNAIAGNVGEVIQSELTFAGALALTTGTWRNVVTIALTAGDWDVWGNVGFYSSTGTTTIARQSGMISLTTATPDTGAPAGGGYFDLPVNAVTGAGGDFPVGRRRVNVNANTTVYLIGYATFAVSTLGVYGGIYARRVR